MENKKADPKNMDIQPYTIAIKRNVAFLSLFPIILYFLLIFLVADGGGILLLCIVPIANILTANIFTRFIFYPLSKVTNRIIKKMDTKWKRRLRFLFVLGGSVVLLIIVGCFLFYLGLVYENPWVMNIVGGSDVENYFQPIFTFLFMGGIPVLLGGFSFRAFLN